jgi:chaperonin GroEL
MYKKVIKKAEFIEHAKAGVNLLDAIVSRTLGPGGLPILLSREDQIDLIGKQKSPLITKDGVTVAESIKVECPYQDLVIQAVMDAAKKTNRIAGDGTTTSILLAKAILFEIFDVLEKDKSINPQTVRRLVEESAEKVYDYLDFQALPLGKNYDLLEEVANISANGDKRVGKILRAAFEKVGSEGTISVDYGNSLETQLEIVEGFEINRGLEGGTRFTNDKSQTKFDCEDVHVILYDGNLNNYSDLLYALNVIANHYMEEAKGQMPKIPPIMVVANEFSASVLTALMIAKADGFNLAAVRSPHQTKIRTQMLEDLAVMLDGTRLGNGNRSLTNCTWEDIGVARRVVATQWNTIFYGHEENEEKILDRIDQLREQKKLTKSEYDRHLFEDRAAGLACAVAKIAVGGATDLEILELYHRYEDALNACKAAIAEGIIPGGGVTFLKCANELVGTLGDEILANALKRPINQILENIGVSEESKIELIKNLEHSEPYITYDACNNDIVNSLQRGIVDPVLVAKTALKNAVSIAALLSTAGGGVIFDRGSK